MSKEPKKEVDPYEKPQRQNPFRAESPIMTFLSKCGQVIILNIVWLIACAPVITAGAATTSLYYAMMKNIRRDRGYALGCFWDSFKRTFLNGALLSLGFGLLGLALWYLWRFLPAYETDQGKLMRGIYIGVIVVTAMLLTYIFPILSRFTMPLGNMLKLSFVMSIRFIYITVAVVAGTALLAWSWFYFLPLPLILVWPGAWCYVCTFLIEKALRRYMPKPKEGEDAWYYE